MQLNLIDRIVSYFSPIAGFRRAQARAFLQSRGYDAASSGRRWKNIRADGSDAERSIRAAQSSVRFRARHLVRNNWIAARGVQAIVNNTVGHGIEMACETKRVNDLFQEWARTNAIDFDGCFDFFGIQQLVLQNVVMSGDVFIKKVKSADQRIPLKIQVLESDYLDTTKDGVVNGNQVKGGIECDPQGRVVAYWLYPEHPGAQVTTASVSRFSSERFTTDDVRLIFKKDRPGSVRGISWLAPVMLRIKDFEEYEDAQLYRQKIASCFAGFLETTDLPLNSSAQRDEEPISEKLQPGTIEVLPAGKRLVMATPPGVGSDYDAYTRCSLLAVAAGLGVTYEALTSDLSNVNFSSGRMGWIEFHRNIESWRWHLIIPQLCEVVWDWFIEAAEVAHGVDRSKVKEPIWTPPKREMIDPVKETSALRDQVRSGFVSYSESLRGLGYDPDALMKEIKGDQQKLDRLELTLESDPRFTLMEKMASNTAEGEPVDNDQSESRDQDT